MTDLPQVFAIVGPSGAGKDTLIRGALLARPDLRLVRRVITRPSEAGGEDYEGVTPDDFARRRENGEFALDWDAHGLSYAIPKAQVTEPGCVLFNGSRAALPAAIRAFPGLRVIVVTAPDAILAARLALRGRESAEEIGRRLERAKFEMPQAVPYQTVNNDGPQERGIARLLAALQPVSA